MGINRCGSKKVGVSIQGWGEQKVRVGKKVGWGKQAGVG